MATAAGHWYTSGTFWTIVSIAVALIIGIATFLVTWAPRQRLLYDAARVTPLLTAAADVQNLKVLHRGHAVSRPHLMQINLTSKGRRDIPSSAFDRGRPLAFDVGARIVEVLQTVCEPASSPTPRVTYEGMTLRLGPELIGRRQTIVISLLVDGSEAHLTCKQATIAQVSVARRDLDLARRQRRIVAAGCAAILAAGVLVRTYFIAQTPTIPPATAPDASSCMNPSITINDPSIITNQCYGDAQTVFVIHGRGWIPGSRVTVRLSGRASHHNQTVDSDGTFNYAINQGHEFFPRQISSGRHTVTVTAATGLRAESCVRCGRLTGS